MHTRNHLGAGGGIGGSQEPGGAIWGILHLKQGPPTSLFGPTLSLRPCRVTSCPGSNPTTYFHPVLARSLKNMRFNLMSYLRFIISWLCVFTWWEYIFCCCRPKVYLSWIRIYLCLLFAIFFLAWRELFRHEILPLGHPHSQQHILFLFSQQTHLCLNTCSRIQYGSTMKLKMILIHWSEPISLPGW